MLQGQWAQKASSQKQKVRDNLSGVAAFMSKAQPIGILLPCAGPGGVIHNDVDSK
jgi:hypothetical protein